MANRQAKVKTISVNALRRSRNRSLRSILSTQTKKLEVAIDSGDVEKAKVELKASITRIDKSVTKGLLHKNTASRKKARLSARVAKMA